MANTPEQWLANKNAVVNAVNKGTATASDIAWYNKWQDLGSPATQQVMWDAQSVTTAPPPVEVTAADIAQAEAQQPTGMLTGAAPQITTFDYVDNRTSGGEQNLYVGNTVKQLDANGLKTEFNAADNDELRAAFGSFDNYLNYMTERQQLISQGGYNANWYDIGSDWDTRSELDKLRDNEDLSRAQIIKGEQTTTEQLKQSAQQSAYRDWAMSQENQQLMAKYGLDKPMVNQDGDQYTWNGSSYVKTSKVDDHLGVGDYAKIIGAVGLGIATGGAASAALASSTLGGSIAAGLGIPAATVGATGGAALGSIVSQGAMTGSVDPTQVLQSALTAGVLDAAGILKGASDATNLATLDGSNIDDLLTVMDSPTLTSLDNAVTGISNTLGVDYNTALKVAQGVATGAVNGADPEAIATAAGTAITTGYAADWMKSQLEDYELGNLFDEGTTTIKEDALESVVNTGLKDAIAGDLGAGTVADALKGYFKNEGSLSFLDPGLGIGELPASSFDLPDWLPSIDFISGDSFDVNYLSNNELANNALINEESWQDIAPNAPQDPNANINVTYDSETLSQVEDAIRAAGSAVDDAVIQPIGDALSSFDDAVIQPAGDALASFDDAVLQPAKDAAIYAGDQINDAVIQPIGDALAAVDDNVIQPILDAIPEVSLPDEGLTFGGLPDVQLPEVSLPDVELPEVSLPDVEVPEVGMLSGGGSASGSFTPKWSELFQYTTLTPYQKKQLAPYTDYIQKARGMLS